MIKPSKKHGKIVARIIKRLREMGKVNIIKLSRENVKIVVKVSKLLREMGEVGMHFGHQPRKLNPKMLPYIRAEHDGMHLINTIKTIKHLKEVSDFLIKSASQGKTFLFVGTKLSATQIIADTALQCNSFYVNQRWLGGMFTNWETIKRSITTLNRLEVQEKRGGFERLPKKRGATLKKEKERLDKYLGGLKKMFAIPDIVIIVGQPEEMNAVRECQKLGIQTITILDTDCDPTLTDLFVPANDDSIKSIRFLLTKFLKSIQKGQLKLKKSIKNRIKKNKRKESKKRNKRAVIQKKDDTLYSSPKKVGIPPNSTTKSLTLAPKPQKVGIPPNSTKKPLTLAPKPQKVGAPPNSTKKPLTLAPKPQKVGAPPNSKKKT